MRPTEQLRAFLDRSSINSDLIGASDLKGHGFSKSGQAWTATSGSVAHVIELQRSRFNDPDSVKFTINVGVALDDIWRERCIQAMASAALLTRPIFKLESGRPSVEFPGGGN